MASNSESECESRFPARYIIVKDKSSAKQLEEELAKLDIKLESVNPKNYPDDKEIQCIFKITGDEYNSEPKTSMVMTILSKRRREMFFGNENFKQVFVGEFPLSKKQQNFKKELDNYLKSKWKEVQICNVVIVGNPEDAVVLLYVKSPEEFQTILSTKHVMDGKQFEVQLCRTKIPQYNSSSGDDHDSNAVSARKGGPDNKNSKGSTKGFSDYGRTGSTSFTVKIDFQSEEKATLVCRLLDCGKIYVPKDYLKYEREGAQLVMDGKEAAVHELSCAVIEQYEARQIYTAQINISNDLAELFVRQMNSGKDYVAEFLDDTDNEHVVILPCGSKNKSLAVYAFDQDEADRAVSKFENQLLCAHVSTAFLPKSGKQEIHKFIKTTRSEYTSAVISFKENERHIEMYGAPNDVIELVGKLEKLVGLFENEEHGGRKY